MSASLVGSEMCIRDRPPVSHNAAISACAAAAPSDGSGRWQQARTPVLAPVSYTHLTLPTICSV
eukprot:11755563-Alexandrium_andersonii.AAC.1